MFVRVHSQRFSFRVPPPTLLQNRNGTIRGAKIVPGYWFSRFVVVFRGAKRFVFFAEAQRWTSGDGEHYAARALYDFTSGDRNELSLRANQNIRIAPRGRRYNFHLIMKYFSFAS